MIRFPTTPEAFIADQEQLMGRKLSEGEREVTVDFAEVFNLIYEDGLRQDHAVLDRDLDKLDEFMSRHREDLLIRRFAEACGFLMFEEWEQGAERSISK